MLLIPRKTRVHTRKPEQQETQNNQKQPKRTRIFNVVHPTGMPTYSRIHRPPFPYPFYTPPLPHPNIPHYSTITPIPDSSLPSALPNAYSCLELCVTVNPSVCLSVPLSLSVSVSILVTVYMWSWEFHMSYNNLMGAGDRKTIPIWPNMGPYEPIRPKMCPYGPS